MGGERYPSDILAGVPPYGPPNLNQCMRLTEICNFSMPLFKPGLVTKIHTHFQTSEQNGLKVYTFSD